MILFLAGIQLYNSQFELSMRALGKANRFRRVICCTCNGKRRFKERVSHVVREHDLAMRLSGIVYNIDQHEMRYITGFCVWSKHA